MTTRLFMFVMLTLALIVAPAGLCLDHGAAIAAPGHAAGMHQGAAGIAKDHAAHGNAGKDHFCPECLPDSFVKAAKAGGPDLVPASPADVLPASYAETFTLQSAPSAFGPGRAPPAPPRLRTFPIRLRL